MLLDRRWIGFEGRDERALLHTPAVVEATLLGIIVDNRRAVASRVATGFDSADPDSMPSSSRSRSVSV